MTNINYFPLKSAIARIWSANSPLTFVGIVILVLFPISVLGLLFDARLVAGAPAWLKPAKFLLSTAIYALTLAAILSCIVRWARTARAMAWIIAVALALENALIVLQAARGVRSHFNTSTALDGKIFALMGISIGVLWLASIVITMALFAQPFRDAAWGWSLRLGMLITVLGSAVGGAMVQPTPTQLAAIKQSSASPSIGAHTVGGADGGAGMPVTGWSRSHGDLRVAHFLGLHAMQILPLLCWAAGRSRRLRLNAQRCAFVIASGTSYLTLVGILFWQAMRGQSLETPDAITASSLAAWFAVTALAIAIISIRPRFQVNRESQIILG